MSKEVSGRKTGMSGMDAFCDKCEGKLVFIGEDRKNPGKFIHQCEECGAKESLNAIFPVIIFDEFGGNN